MAKIRVRYACDHRSGFAYRHENDVVKRQPIAAWVEDRGAHGIKAAVVMLDAAWWLVEQAPGAAVFAPVLPLGPRLVASLPAEVQAELARVDTQHRMFTRNSARHLHAAQTA